jgi:hypothetical protein
MPLFREASDPSERILNIKKLVIGPELSLGESSITFPLKNFFYLSLLYFRVSETKDKITGK